jgi:hypothetical protein
LFRSAFSYLHHQDTLLEVYTYIHYCVKHFKNKRNYRINSPF